MQTVATYARAGNHLTKPDFQSIPKSRCSHHSTIFGPCLLFCPLAHPGYHVPKPVWWHNLASSRQPSSTRPAFPDWVGLLRLPRIVPHSLPHNVQSTSTRQAFRLDLACFLLLRHDLQYGSRYNSLYLVLPSKYSSVVPCNPRSIFLTRESNSLLSLLRSMDLFLFCL